MTKEQTSALIACYNAECDWSEDNIKSVIIAVCDMLKELDTDAPMYVRYPFKIKWINTGFANCLPFDGILEFGPRVFVNSFNGYSFGYKREKPFIQRRCKTRIHNLIWLILHEYCHLYKDQLRHNMQFYELIDSKFEKYFKDF